MQVSARRCIAHGRDGGSRLFSRSAACRSAAATSAVRGSLKLLQLKAACLCHLLRGHLLDALREGPMVAVEIDGDVAAFAVELISRFCGDGRACLPRPGAMLIDAAVDAHEYPLCVLASHGRRALGPIRPFLADHDNAVAVLHFRVYDIIVIVGQYLADFEAKGFLQPLKRRAIVLVDDCGNESRAGRCGGHMASHVVSILSKY